MANPPKPWTAEYARSRRATCKTCKNPIEKEVLRIGNTFRAEEFDDYKTSWRHADCFLKEQGQFQTLDDVKGVYDLRWGDQQKIYKYIGGLGQSFASGSGGITAIDNNNEYAIENAKNSRATCKSCKKKIGKGEIRISNNSKFSHAKCFVETGMWRSPMEKMPGWDTLTHQDKQSLQTIADESNQDSGKKSKKRKRDEREALPLEKQINALWKKQINPLWKKQTNTLWKIKDELQKHVKTKELREMLKANDQNAASRSEYVLRERCADGMLFGALPKCSICECECGLEYSDGKCSICGCKCGLKYSDGKCSTCGCECGLEYSDGKYKCLGHVSPWTKCTFSTTNPERLKGKWKIPSKGHNEYLTKWFKTQKKEKPLRILTPHLENEGTEEQSQNSETAFFKDLKVAIIGLPNETHAAWKEKLKAAGGKVLDRLTEDADYLVTSENQIDKYMPEIENAQKMEIPVLDESFLVDCLEKKRWLREDENYKIKADSLKLALDNVKRRVRDPVHVSSGLQGTGHILATSDGKFFYNITLNMCDLSSNINSYYILQVIVTEDKKNIYHVFRKWDRVGNDRDVRQILEKASSESDAISKFEELFSKHTGNEWEIWVNKVNCEKKKPDNEDNFEKKNDKYFPLDLVYGDQIPRPPQVHMRSLGAKSKLDPRVIDLMNILFDPETYRDAMKELDIRMPIMPLGKLSESNIREGNKALKQVEEIIIKMNKSDPLRESKLVVASNRLFTRIPTVHPRVIETEDESKLVDASNRFFTLIPTVHPRVIETEDDLKSKTRMLEALQDIEIASKLINFENEGDDPFYGNYEKLNCKISPLPHDSSDYRLIEKYLKNTHAPTHTKWRLELEDAYKIDRFGEYDAYFPHKSNLKNCMLLWHGSRTTNFVSILSRGLRIAPPEAPDTGYMFGKGIYLADLGSKSAKYCHTDEKNPIGFTLLSEVALGEVYEIEKAEYMEKPPEGKDSTKGVGRCKYLTENEPWGDDVIVPCGGIDPQTYIPPKDALKDALKYNEYIVYKTDQVKLQFLLKVRFHFKNS